MKIEKITTSPTAAATPKRPPSGTTCPDPEEEAMIARADAVKWRLLEEWSQTRRGPRHAAFLHAHTGGGDEHGA